MKNSVVKIALVFGCVSAGVVLANDSAPVQISPVFARVEIAAPSFAPLETCQGADGTYTLIHVTGSGPITSADPRLTGTFFADALILDNPNTGIGLSTDKFYVVDPATGAVKMRGRAWGLDAFPNPVKALAAAELADGSHFLALSTVTLPAGPTDPLVIEYGGAGVPSPDRAITIGGDCGKLLNLFGFEK